MFPGIGSGRLPPNQPENRGRYSGMAKPVSKLAKVLDRLAKFYGEPGPPDPSDPYEMILYVNCGYPATDASCTKGLSALRKEVGLRPDHILAAPDGKLAALMRLGGIVPELRAERLKEIAALVKDEFDGDLRTALTKPLPQARKALKKFPTIGDPGADKILLFSGTAAITAVPSNCIRVPLRLGFGEEKKNYAASYRSAQEAIASQLPAEGEALIRAYLLLKRHGQEVCKQSRPLCERCPVTDACVYFQTPTGRV
jgi:endonuclease-3